MIVFENKGTLDIRAITTLGVSVKDENRSTIGYFGTGLKYAISILLRTGHSIDIQDGHCKTFNFSTKDVAVRGETFQVVCMTDETGNHQELGFTTQLGKNWEVWQAFRELYCNAQDEGGTTSQCPEDFRSQKDCVRVIVTGEKIESVWSERHKYILSSRLTPVFRGAEVDVYKKPSIGRAIFFYQGIRVQESNELSKYDFNFTRKISLTEDRTVRYPWEIPDAIVGSLFDTSDKKFITSFVHIPGKTPSLLEEVLNFSCVPSIRASETFLDVVGELRKKYVDTHISLSAIAVHKQRRESEKNVLPDKSVELTSIEQRQLDKAKRFGLEALDINFEEFPIIVAETLGSRDHLGRADMQNRIIYLSRSCFKEGTKYVLMGLIEEYTHIKHQVYDETLEQKLIYLNMIASLSEQIVGDPL